MSSINHESTQKIIQLMMTSQRFEIDIIKQYDVMINF